MGELTGIGRAQEALARGTSRRGFLGRVGRGVVALAGGGLVASALAPERAAAFHICGHIYTTGSCPHPYFPHSRTDRFGYPVHPSFGFAIDDEGNPYVNKKQKRTKICEEWVPERYHFVKNPHYGGGWTRCCFGRLRHIQDCCSPSKRRINGDASLTGYCPSHLRVFCITYRELNHTC
jgi:hypothetical protein